LSQWGLDVPIRTSPDEGLINHTWLVGEPPIGVLQWVNPIVAPQAHNEIAHVTAQLQASGILTPHLLPTLEGAQWVVQPDGCWRMLSFVPGSTVDAFSSAAQASSAAALVGRFHAALAQMTLEFPHQRLHAHNTVAHMASLDRALSEADVHPLGSLARALGHDILEAWEHWEGPLELPTRVCHGDLKVSNIRMDRTGQVAICLLDLDTLGRLPYSVELGDAWRSWCNPAPEDDFENVRFDLEIFTATAGAWLAHAPPLAAIEKASLVPGIQRICLELAARFCGDAVRNSYFREDTQRYPEPGTHNLARARTQLALAAAAHDQASACEAVIAAAAQQEPAVG
jgi:Ser/Thr protein kinase RdoA (MazF antagonist)